MAPVNNSVEHITVPDVRYDWIPINEHTFGALLTAPPLVFNKKKEPRSAEANLGEGGAVEVERLEEVDDAEALEVDL